MQTYTVLLQTYYAMTNRPHTITHGYVVASSPENARLQGQDDYGKTLSRWLVKCDQHHSK